jgi:hypothetical protein
VEGGTRVSGQVSLVDLVPTLLDAVGLPDDDMLAGYSLLRPRPPEAPVFAERGTTRVTLRWPIKLFEWGRGNPRVVDLSADPDELAPIREGRRTRKKFEALAASLKADAQAERAGWWVPEEENPKLGEMSAEIRERMDQLGYGGE